MSAVVADPYRETAVPQLPDPRPGNEREFMRAVRELFEVREGISGDPLDQNVTVRDLLYMGKLDRSALNGKVYVRMPGGDLSFLDIGPKTSPEYGPPPAPKNVIVTAALATFIIEWDDPNYHNHAFAEVFRASVDDIGQAVKIGTSEGSMYADKVGLTNATRYFWVRFRSKADVPGPFNRVAGTGATTGFVVTGDIADAAITTTKLADGSVTTVKYADASVTTVKIGDSQVSTAKMADGSVVTTKIGDSAVTTVKVNDLSITTGKFADLSVTTGKLADSAVTTTKITDSSVTTPKVAANAIDAGKLNVQTHGVTGLAFTNNSPGAGSVAWSSCTISWNGNTYAIGAGNTANECIWLDRSVSTVALQGSSRASFEANYNNADGDILLAINSGGAAETIYNATLVTSSGIKTDAVVARTIAALSVVAGKLAANAIVAGDGVIATAAIGTALIQDAAITNAKIGNLAVDSAKMADASVVTAKINDAAVTNAKIGLLAVQTGNIADANITTAKIALLSVTSAIINDLAVITGKINDLAVTTAKINDLAATTAKINDAAITNAKIGTAAVQTANIQDAAITNAKLGTASVQTANIVDANITSAKIGDAEVGTLKIAGNAVTVPASAYTSGSTSIAGSPPITLQTVTFTTSGGQVFISGTCGCSAGASALSVTLAIKRDGTEIARTNGSSSSGLSLAVSASDTPTAGSHTYTLEAIGVTNPTGATAQSRSLFCIETKR